MKQIYWIVALSLLCNMTTFTSCQRKEDVKPDEKKSSIVILYENDVHCGIDGYTKMAGCAMPSTGRTRPMRPPSVAATSCRATRRVPSPRGNISLISCAGWTTTPSR